MVRFCESSLCDDVLCMEVHILLVFFKIPQNITGFGAIMPSNPVFMLNPLGLTQLVGGWGYLGGRSPPKYPQYSPDLRNSFNYSFTCTRGPADRGACATPAKPCAGFRTLPRAWARCGGRWRGWMGPGRGWS